MPTLRRALFPVLCLLVGARCIASEGCAAQTPRSQAGVKPAAASRQSFVVLIDAAHGGDDNGARLTDRMLEKDLTLSLSVRLRSALVARGIAVVTTRDSDQTLTAPERTKAANRSSAAACLLLHVTGAGRGVHLFTSSNPPPSNPPLANLSASAHSPASQSGSASSSQPSLRLASELNAALATAEIPVTLGSTSLQPLDNFTCPAVAVEVAPPAATGKQGAGIADAAYQEKIIAALADAVVAWRTDLRQ